MKIFANFAEKSRVHKRYNIAYINNFSSRRIENGLEYKKKSSSVFLNYFFKTLSRQITDIGKQSNEGAIKVIDNQIKIFKKGSWTNYIDENVWLNKIPSNTPDGGWSIDGLTEYYKKGMYGYILLENTDDYVDLEYAMSLSEDYIENFLDKNNIIFSHRYTRRHYYNETFLSSTTQGEGDFKIKERKVFVFINTTQSDFIEIKKDLKPLFPDNAKIKILMRGENFDKNDFKPIKEVNLTGLYFKDWCEIEYTNNNCFLISNLSLAPCTLRGFIAIEKNKKYFETYSGERALTCDIPNIKKYDKHSQTYFYNNHWYWLYITDYSDGKKVYLADIDLMNNSYSETQLAANVSGSECFLIPHETHKDQMYCMFGKTYLVDVQGNILDQKALCKNNYIYVDDGVQEGRKITFDVSIPKYVTTVTEKLCLIGGKNGGSIDEIRKGYNVAEITINGLKLESRQLTWIYYGAYILKGETVGYAISPQVPGGHLDGFRNTFIDGRRPSVHVIRNIIQYYNLVFIVCGNGIFSVNGDSNKIEDGVLWTDCLATGVSKTIYTGDVRTKNVLLNYGDSIIWSRKNKRKFKKEVWTGLTFYCDFGGHIKIPHNEHLYYYPRDYQTLTKVTDNEYTYCNKPNIYFEYNGENVGDDILLFIPPDEQ